MSGDATDRRRPAPTSGSLAAVAALLCAGVVLTGITAVGVVAVAVEGAVALGAAALLLDRDRPLALGAGTFLAGAGSLLLAGGTAVAAAGTPPAVGLTAALAAGGLLVLVPVLLGTHPSRLAAGVGLAGCLAVAAVGVAAAATVRGSPTAGESLTATVRLVAPGVLTPPVPFVEAAVAVGLGWRWAGRAVVDGFAAPDGRVAAARSWLLRGTFALLAGSLVAPALGPGVARAAADAATHVTLGAAVAVAAAGYAATVLLGGAGTPALRRPVGWLAAVVGAAGVLVGAFALPTTVGAAARTVVAGVPGVVTAVGLLTDVGGSAGAVRAVVTPLVVFAALAPAFALLATAVLSERVGVVRRERGLAALATGLLAAAALVSAVLTRDPARTVAAVALAVLVWDAAEFGLSMTALVGDEAGIGGAPRVERGHATASLAVAGLAVAGALGLASVGGPAPSGGNGVAVALLLGAAAAGLLALRDG